MSARTAHVPQRSSSAACLPHLRSPGRPCCIVFKASSSPVWMRAGRDAHGLYFCSTSGIVRFALHTMTPDGLGMTSGSAPLR